MKESQRSMEESDISEGIIIKVVIFFHVQVSIPLHLQLQCASVINFSCDLTIDQAN